MSVEEDFPAWCRMTGNELISIVRHGRERSFLVCKGPLAARVERPTSTPSIVGPERGVVAVQIPASLPSPSPAPAIAPLSVMGIGSWPRPRWMRQAIHDHI